MGKITTERRGKHDHQINTVSSEDLNVVANIHAKCFFDSWDTKMLQQILDMPGSFGISVRRPRFDSMAGFALARVVADECELLSLGVAPECRGQGIAKALLQGSMLRAFSKEACWFFLEVATDNDAAMRLYLAHGLVKIGNRPDYYENEDGSRTDACTMRCNLKLLFNKNN